MKKLKYTICFLLVSLIASGICFSMDAKKVVSAPSSPLQRLKGLMHLNFWQRSPEGSGSNFVSGAVGNASFSSILSDCSFCSSDASDCSSSASDWSLNPSGAKNVVGPITYLGICCSFLGKGDNLQPWQRSLVEQVHKEMPGFECCVLDQDSVQVSGNFMVGNCSWAVYKVNGKPTEHSKHLKVKENQVPWRPKILVTSAKLGRYNIDIDTPEPKHFEFVSRLLSKQKYCYDNVANLKDFFSTKEVQLLRPNGPHYCE